MICHICGKDRKEKDFFKNQEGCYRCVYAKKISKIPERACVICNKDCGTSRWIYCSAVCSEIGRENKTRNYWVNKVKSS